MPKKKPAYSPFKLHFWLPFSLSVLIVIIGSVMTLMSQTDTASYSTVGGGQEYPLTGPGVIALGVLVSAVVLYYRRYLK